MSNNKELPSSPDAGILQRLIRARQFLEHATSHAACGTDFDYMLAAHGADNAVEYTLKLVADHIRYEEITGNSLPGTELSQIAGACAKFLQDEHNIKLPYYQEIKTLRQVRNLVQHGSFTPGSDIVRQMTIAERFFASICESIFGLKPDELRISSIINDATIQRHLRAAEEALYSNKYEDSVRFCRNAFEETLFKYRKGSPVATREIPARAALSQLCPEADRYIACLSEELDALRMRMDSNQLQRFKDIIAHLPTDPNFEFTGYIVMQRPWEQSDAEFCYGFVAENIIRLQNAKFAPLYIPYMKDEYRFDESIGGISLASAEQEYLYLDFDSDINFDYRISLIYAPQTLRDELESLTQEKVYRWESNCYKNNILESETSYQVRLRLIRSELVTHDPVRWKVVIGSSQVPLTWHKRDFENGEIACNSPKIQECNVDELISLYPIDDDIAQRIITARKEHGTMNAQLLRQVEGITDEQVQWIEAFTRL